MPLLSTSLENRLITKFKAQGFKVDESHCLMNQVAKCVAEAVVEEILTNGLVVVVSGSSAGSYKIT